MFVTLLEIMFKTLVLELIMSDCEVNCLLEESIDKADNHSLKNIWLVDAVNCAVKNSDLFKMVASEMKCFGRTAAQLWRLERSILEIRIYW